MYTTKKPGRKRRSRSAPVVRLEKSTDSHFFPNQPKPESKTSPALRASQKQNTSPGQVSQKQRALLKKTADGKPLEAAFNPATLRQIELKLQALAQNMYFDPAQREIFDEHVTRMTSSLHAQARISLTARFQRENNKLSRRSRVARSLLDMPEDVQRDLKRAASPLIFFRTLMAAPSLTE